MPAPLRPHPISVDLVSRLVATQFPQWAQLPVVEVVPGGNDNRTFRLGDDLLVRLPSATGYTAQVAKEQLWLPRLAAALPLPVPVPVAQGAPGHGYDWQWSVYRWIQGDPASTGVPTDADGFATALGTFLSALHRVDPTGGPAPGEHNFHRGGPLATYDAETRDAITALGSAIDGASAQEVWQAALDARWVGRPVWVHGDVAAGNLLIHHGRLAAVIDFGCCAVGDPACDLTITWTLFEGSGREAFQRQLTLDGGTWSRARGWALWKALITLVQHIGTGSTEEAAAHRVITEVIAEHRRTG